MSELTQKQIDSVSEMQTCAVSNAIESLNIRSRTEGFMTPDIKSMFPEMGTMVGLLNYKLQFICDKLISCFMSNLHMKEQHSHETKIYIVHELELTQKHFRYNST